MHMGKRVLYVDMDNVLADFRAGIERLDEETKKAYAGHLDDVPGIFGELPPVKDGLESYQRLAEVFDTYVLSTSPWENPGALADKLAWVKRHLGQVAYKRLIITHHKNLNKGDFLVDDRPNNGAEQFEGEWIQFGSPRFPDWQTVTEYLIRKQQEFTD